MTYTVSPPTAFPLPGFYDSPQIITLLSDFPGAEIHYTLDGSPPTDSSPMFDPYRLIPMVEFGQELQDRDRNFSIRAISMVGNQISNPVTFLYQIEPRSRDEYISQEVLPWVKMIRDFDNDKMYLLLGSEKALLIDCGMGSGDLREEIESFTGGFPLDVVITHAHPDHIAKIGQFQSDCRVYMHHDDLPLVKRFVEHLHYEIDLSKIIHVDEGFIFDLGDRKLKVFHIPGHSKGCIVLLDEESGILFAGDAFGSNRPTIVDALWMQMSETSIDEYLSTLQVFRSKTAGKIQLIYGGHNDQALVGESYLDHLQEAAQRLVDMGIEALTPSPRPSGVWQSVSGDRLKDPNWAAINVNRDNCLSSPPEKIATLSNFQLIGATLEQEFKPGTFLYTANPKPGLSEIKITPMTTSRRAGKLTINDSEISSGKPFPIQLSRIGANQPILIKVTSPDQTTSNTYSLVVKGRQEKMLYKNKHFLSYVEFGDPSGYPILIQHGLIASIHDQYLFESLVQAGKRLIAVARPGYGDSSPYKMQNIAEWGEIISLLVHKLDLLKFDVLGMSSGAPYSYAIGYKFPDQVRKIFVFSGTPALFDERVLSHWPYEVDKNANLPILQKLARDLFFSNLNEDDTRRNDISDSMQNDCFGIAQDLKLRCVDWGFQLSEIKPAVLMQHSREDLSIPLITAEITSNLIPNCRLTIRDGEHFSQKTLDDFFESVILV